MRRLKDGAAVDSAMLIFIRLITALLSMIIYKLLTLNFSLEEYGVYSQATLVSTTMTAFTILGMTDAINYFFNKNLGKDKGVEYVRTIIVIQCIIGLIGAMLICTFSSQISAYFKNDEVKPLLKYVAFIPLLTNLINMLQVLFISYKKAKIIALRNLMFTVAKVVVVLLACYILKSIKVVLIGLLIIDIIVFVYMYYYCNHNFFKFSLNKSKLGLSKEILFYSIPMATYIITNSLSRNMDKLVVGWFGDSNELALYSIGAKELPFDLFTSSFITVLVPYITRYIANKNYIKASESFSKYIQMGYTITWILAIGALITSKELMLILYDKKYISALTIFCLYIIVDMFRFANTSLVFSAQGRTKELVIYSITALVFNMVLNIVFYNIFGFVGPAIATVLITFLMSAIMMVRSSYLLKTKINYMLNIKQAIILLLECAFCGVVAYCFKVNLFKFLSPIVSFILTYAIYGTPLVLLNIKKILSLFKDINSLKMESKCYIP